MPPVIELKNVGHSFNAQPLLAGFNLTLRAGEKLALVGESSCGKSTLLKIIAGLINPNEGSVKLFGQELKNLSSAELRRIRQRLGMQFQSGALFDSMTVLENLLLARQESAPDAKGRAEAVNPKEPMELLAAVGLASAAGRKPYELSGGMRKRAALARALTIKPDLAIFDEPTAGLDPVTSRRIINLIEKIGSLSGSAMLMATTDVQTALYFSSSIAVINEGRLWAHGRVDDLKASGDPFVLKLLSRLIAS